MLTRPALALALLVAGLAGPVPAAPSTPSPAVRSTPAGALFNGRDLSGWRVFLADRAADTRAVWSVAPDGVLRLATKASCLLRTERAFSNYRLHAEWRWPADAPANTNGGIFFHIGEPDAIWPVCLGVQIANTDAGQLVGQGGADIPAAPLINAKKRTPKLAAASEKPLGQWNTGELVCRDDNVEVTINGVRQNRVEKISVTSGGIGIQLEGFPVEFRNLWLTPL